MNPPHSLQYGYAPNPGASTMSWANISSRPAKRPLSVSESDDCDDVFSEESSKEQLCRSPDDTDSCQMLSRKKRRGVIEKKRRDRINTSLTELKRLVPSAFEKQGSAKLEKAEILQMTVDHLKKIHANAKSIDALTYDPHKFAMDYHNMGFRECATEVARYLVTIEGMDIQDPLRLRLMSHLQCFAAQRELASKQASVSSWGYGTSSQNFPPILNSNPTSPSTLNPTLTNHIPHQSTVTTPLIHHSNIHDLNNHFDLSSSYAHPSPVQSNPDASTRHMSSASVLTPLTPVVTTSVGSAFSYAHNSGLNAFNATDSNNGPHGNYNQGNNSAQMKPYRPWGGAEVAY